MEDTGDRSATQPEISADQSTATSGKGLRGRRKESLDARERLLDRRETLIAQRERAADLRDKTASRREIDAEDIYPPMDDR